LLIYDFHLQNIDADMDNAGMLRALLALAPHLSIYVISFLVCTVWWMGHHMFIHDLARVDARLLFLNSMFLMWIAILPFPTALLGHHPLQPVVIALYGIVCTLVCVFFTVMRWYASFRGHLMRMDISANALRRDLRISSCFPLSTVPPQPLDTSTRCRACSATRQFPLSTRLSGLSNDTTEASVPRAFR
jgi:uncharacterized membrane protein